MNRLRPLRNWRVGKRQLELGRRAWIVAIINVSEDSFYAASRIRNEQELLEAARMTIRDGADVIDVGAESTRPGAVPISATQEQSRLVPGLELLRRAFPEMLFSVDTRHAETARAALASGADIVNDVSGLRDPDMGQVIAESGCGAILMHLRGVFATMHRLGPLADPCKTVSDGFVEILERAVSCGIGVDQIVLDPGFGFGKNLDENFTLLARIGEWHELGYPLLAGVSRKSFLGNALGGRPPEGRGPATLAAITAAALSGVHLLRVHDVAESRDALQIVDKIIAVHESRQS
jgi:dihydropteroate synthase